MLLLRIRTLALVFLYCSVCTSALAERYRVTDAGFGETDAEQVVIERNAPAPIAADTPKDPESPSTEDAIDKTELTESELEKRANQEPIKIESETLSETPIITEGKPELVSETKPAALISDLDMDAEETAVAPDETTDVHLQSEEKTSQDIPTKKRVVRYSVSDVESGNVDIDPRSVIDLTIGNAPADKTSPLVEPFRAEPKQPSVFEQTFLESERKEREEILRRLEEGKGANQIDVTTVNEDDFIDADELAKRGARTAGESPYYIHIDSEGRISTTEYDPDLEKAFAASQRNKKFDFTQATILERPKRSEQEALLENADPIAKSILFGGQEKERSYFEVFSDSCCKELILDNRKDIEKGLSYYFDLKEDDLSYRFKEGDSRYLLIKLPFSSGQNYALRMRTFIRKFKDKGIDKGVFFPQLVSLDKDKKPLRIITGPLLKYEPETWSKYGYLEGIFDIDQTVDFEERYLLINTTRQIQKEASVIELENETVSIKHMNVGSFEIEVFAE